MRFWSFELHLENILDFTWVSVDFGQKTWICLYSLSTTVNSDHAEEHFFYEDKSKPLEWIYLLLLDKGWCGSFWTFCRSRKEIPNYSTLKYWREHWNRALERGMTSKMIRSFKYKQWKIKLSTVNRIFSWQFANLIHTRN